MIIKEYYVVGVMSGTSLDGIDLAYIKFTFKNEWSFNIINCKTVDYDSLWRNSLKELVNMSEERLTQLDINYTSFLSETITQFIDEFNISKLDFLCSHGHTALHNPEKGYTYQIGNRKELSKNLNKTVVCDFRVQDVKLGGQGAPLVPIGDKLLFSEYDFCLNLGGFANISLEDSCNRIAYDICPVNIVLNYYTRKIGLEYDSDGDISRKGEINEDLLKSLNNLDYYRQSYPKSLGLEWVNQEIMALIDSFELSIDNILRTFTEHVAIQISREINIKSDSSILITGGGAYNSFLIERIKNFTKNKIIIPSKSIIEFKEALIFGLLGVLKIRGEINCLKSVTGAKKNHSSGVIFHP